MTQAVARRAANRARVGLAQKPAELAKAHRTRHPRIASIATAHPTFTRDQEAMARWVIGHLELSSTIASDELAEVAQKIRHVFSASGVERRQAVIDIDEFYSHPRTTGERMAAYEALAYPLGRRAIDACLAAMPENAGGPQAREISDFVVTSCTGYCAPGLDIQLARELGMSNEVRRVIVGHMGCTAGVIGLRQALAASRAHPGARVLQLSLELSSLHFAPTLGLDQLTSMALFGDAAAALMLSDAPGETGPEVVDVYCAADFTAVNQLTWKIGDEGFLMGLSPRVPVTVQRRVRGAVEQLLTRHHLEVGDVAHWLVHPGGPSILDVVQKKLELSDEQMEDSRRVLAEHGNCSSVTILLILDRLVRSGRAKPGEWAVMMAFGPGLTVETCLLRF